MFSTTAAIAIGDSPKVIRKATFGTHVFWSLLHSAIRIVFSASATATICNSPGIIGLPALFTVKIHFVPFLKRNISPFSRNSIKTNPKSLIYPPIFQLKPFNGSSAVFSCISLIFSISPRIYSLVLPTIPNIERGRDNYSRQPLACIFSHKKSVEFVQSTHSRFGKTITE